jgi:Ca-activated chloride channel family protein
MNWAAPAYAWLLLLGIPAVILIHRAFVQQQQDLSRLAGGGRASLRIRPLLSILIATAAFLLAVAALCRPQWGEVTVQQQSKGLDILIALDVSRSMLADDLLPTRLAAAKDAVARLLPHLQGDRIGLIAFAGSAFLVCPLTSDYSTFGGVLAETGTDTIPLGGSSLASALVEAKRAFGQSQGQGRFLIVISDGEDHGSDVAATTRALRDAGDR